MDTKWTSVVERLIILFIIADIGIAIFYYLRISDLIQEIWPGAYNVVFGNVEYHHMAGIVLTIVLMIMPLIFYSYNLKMENLYFRSVSINSGLTTLMIIFGNLMVFLTEIGITLVMFDLGQGNILSGQKSEWYIYAGWMIALLIPMFHQVSANCTVIGMTKLMEKSS